MRRSSINDQVLTEANDWLLDFEESEVGPGASQEFMAWLRRSPEHVQAFLQATAFWEEAGLLSRRAGLDVGALVERAVQERNVVPLGAPAQLPAPRARAVVRLGWAAAIGAAAVLGAIFWNANLRVPTYATGIGEQRSVVLDDGSTVELNARSRLRVRFSDRERVIELLDGQALFAVAKDASRPFVVAAGGARVRAVGTQFDVYRKRTGTVVTVVEGRVAVEPAAKSAMSPLPVGAGASLPAGATEGQLPGAPAPGRSGSEVLLAAGERLILSPTRIAAPEPVDVEVAVAWTEGKLIFDSTPLGDVVDEFNRYNRRQLVIRDPELYGYHVSGVFPSTDTDRMIELLRNRFGVVITRSDDRIEISRPAGADNPADL